MFGWGGYKKLKEDSNEKREDKRRGLRSQNFEELLIFQPIDLDSGKKRRSTFTGDKKSIIKKTTFLVSLGNKFCNLGDGNTSLANRETSDSRRCPPLPK